MPRKPIDYSKALVYKLVCKDLNIKDLYVGSTTNFNNRKRSHKSCCTNENSRKYNYKVYKYIRENGGWDNFEMILIENFPCCSKQDLHARERYWKEELHANLNCVVPGRTIKEYYEDNQEILLKYQKKYQKKNKEKISKKQKEYREKNRDKIEKYYEEYYEQNKDKILKKQQEKITCECGSILSKNHLSRHKRSQKHIKYVNSLINK